MLTPQYPVDEGERRVHLIRRLGHRVNGSQVFPATGDPVDRRTHRNENLLVRTHPGGFPLLLQDSDHFEGNAPDLDRTPHQEGCRCTQLLRNLVPQHRHAATTLELTQVEVPSVAEAVVVDVEVLGRGPNCLVAGVPAEVRYLEPGAGLLRDGQKTRRLRPKRRGVLQGQSLRTPMHATELGLPPADREHVGSQALDLVLHPARGPLTQGHHRNDGRHTDDDAQGCKDRAERVRPNRSQGDPEYLRDKHD